MPKNNTKTITVRHIPQTLYDKILLVQKEEQVGFFGNVGIQDAAQCLMWAGVQVLEEKYRLREEQAKKGVKIK